MIVGKHFELLFDILYSPTSMASKPQALKNNLAGGCIFMVFKGDFFGKSFDKRIKYWQHGLLFRIHWTF